MVCLATAGHAAFQVSDIELTRSGPSYTVDSISALAAIYPEAALHLIVGSDTCREMDSWKDLERLVGLCRVAVVERPSEDGSPQPDSDLPHWAERAAGIGLAVSATAIRRLVAQGQSARYLVPDGVAEYIARRGMYR
jgi:nicotinate-nucleotide adenylyltransferase